MQSEGVYSDDGDVDPDMVSEAASAAGRGRKSVPAHRLQILQGRGEVLVPACFLFESDTTVTADPLPDIPIMLVTRLRLELLLQEPLLDLRAVSKIILDDIGATLQIFRLVGEEYPIEDERPVRIEDCIAGLDTAAWFGAVCACTVIHSSRTLNAWHHARRIGCFVEEIAERAGGSLPGEGWLVGLLHEIGSLPELLGWQAATTGLDDHAIAILLAEHWHLPRCVLWSGPSVERRKAIEGPKGRKADDPCSAWKGILAAAHAQAAREDALAAGLLSAAPDVDGPSGGECESGAVTVGPLLVQD